MSSNIFFFLVFELHKNRVRTVIKVRRCCFDLEILGGANSGYVLFIRKYYPFIAPCLKGTNKELVEERVRIERYRRVGKVVQWSILLCIITTILVLLWSRLYISLNLCVAFEMSLIVLIFLKYAYSITKPLFCSWLDMNFCWDFSSITGRSN